MSLHGVAKGNWDTQEHENQHEINSQQKNQSSWKRKFACSTQFFSSLLEEECFNMVTANPRLNSKVLPKTRLLEIAHQVVDWENEGTVEINSETYRASGNALVLDS